MATIGEAVPANEEAESGPTIDSLLEDDAPPSK
jgi:hypothetical protein